jgi:hypothetical protein
MAFDGASDVELVDVVAGSCAVPGAWPPVTIGNRRYMVMFSLASADHPRAWLRSLHRDRRHLGLMG